MSTLRIADLPRLRREGRRAGITSVCTAHPLAIEAALISGAGRRHAGADRGHLQPGQPGRRLHRHDAGAVPRLGAGHRGARRLFRKRPDPRRRPSRAEPLEGAPGRGRDGQGRGHDRGLCGGGVLEAPSRLLDGLRWRTRGARRCARGRTRGTARGRGRACRQGCGAAGALLYRRNGSARARWSHPRPRPSRG